MRLPTKKKAEKISTAKKEAKKVEKADQERKREDKVFFDDKDYPLDEGEVTLDKLRVGMARCCNLVGINIKGERVELTWSWQEFMIIMLNALAEKVGKENLKKEVVARKVVYGTGISLYNGRESVLSSESAINKGKEDYRNMVLGDTGYNIRGLMSDVNCCTVIRNVVKSMGYKNEEVTFKLYNKVQGKGEDFWMDKAEKYGLEVTEDMEKNKLDEMASLIRNSMKNM